MFICVGNYKIKGDSLGPRIGSFIEENKDRMNYIAEVIGTKNNPLGYNRLINLKEYILSNKNKRKIIIDSALGKSENIGQIFISKKCSYIASSINKGTSLEADYIVKGVVGNLYNSSEMNKKELAQVDEKIIQNTMNKIIEILPILV